MTAPRLSHQVGGSLYRRHFMVTSDSLFNPQTTVRFIVEGGVLAVFTRERERERERERDVHTSVLNIVCLMLSALLSLSSCERV